MADFDGVIDPAADWAEVPQLSTQAQALAGPGGPMNAQAVALAKRTKYLLGLLESKAAAEHEHEIGAVEGLEEALAKKQGASPVLSMLSGPHGTLGFRNLLINGDMLLNQRDWIGNQLGADHNSQSKASFGFDGWRAQFGVTKSLNGVWSPSFNSTLGERGRHIFFQVTGANPAPTVADDYVMLIQKLEGHNASVLGYGTPNAKPATLSFLSKDAPDGYVMSIAVRNKASTKAYITTVTLSKAAKRYSVVIPPCTSGEWENGYESGLEISFCFRVGTGYYTTYKDGWSDGNFIAHTTQTDLFRQPVNSAVSIADVQLEVGETATPFEHRPLTLEHAFCQRYYQSGLVSVLAKNTAYLGGSWKLPVWMRVTPTLKYWSKGGNGTVEYSGGLTTSVNVGGIGPAGRPDVIRADAIMNAVSQDWWLFNYSLDAEL